MKWSSPLIRNERTWSLWLQTDPKNFQVTKFPVVHLVIQSSLIKFCQYYVILNRVLNGTRNYELKISWTPKLQKCFRCFQNCSWFILLEKKKIILIDQFHKWKSSDNIKKFNERLPDGVNFKFRKRVYKKKEIEFHIRRGLIFQCITPWISCFRQQLT